VRHSAVRCVTGESRRKGPRSLAAIDCSPLLVRSAGVKTWLYHWTRGLMELAPDSIRPVLGAPGGTLTLEGGLRTHAARLALLAALNVSRGALSEWILGGCEVFHVSNLLRYPPRSSRLSATIHDMTAWIFPEMHTQGTRDADHQFARVVLKRADGMIAVSENTRQDAIRILDLAPEKIRVIYPGVPASYFAARPVPRAPRQKPWFLFVGTIEPRKNIDGLLDAWSSLPSSWRREFELRLVGMRGWSADPTLRRLAQLSGEGDTVRYLGYVAEDELPAMTAGACALVYPALYEGFGIPLVQAMAAGCPVITSNVSSMAEVTAGAALLVDPRSQSEIAQAIRRIGESPSLRSELAERGRERARLFTWPRACAESLAYLSSLAD
jgi:glycosyltransferase involved in cell wall biosynthesis